MPRTRLLKYTWYFTKPEMVLNTKVRKAMEAH